MARCAIGYRSPTHFWAERLGRPQDLLLIAGAAASTRSAIDALETGDLELARRLWGAVDGDALLAAWNEQNTAMKAMAHELTLARPADPNGSPRARLPKGLSRAVFERDGYRCRYCAIRVVTQWQHGHVPGLVAAFPELTPTLRVENGSLIGSGRSGRPTNVDTKKWMWFLAGADHVVPASQFGPTTLENLVTSCGGCNYGKMNWTLEQLDVIDPRTSTDT